MRDAGLCQMDSIDQACNLVLGAVKPCTFSGLPRTTICSQGLQQENQGPESQVKLGFPVLADL